VKSDSSYSFQFNEMARPARLEPAPFCLEGRCSIQLSYGRVGYIDFKPFIAGNDTILAALTFRRRGRLSILTSHKRTLRDLDRPETLAPELPLVVSTGLFGTFGTIRCLVQSSQWLG
jgi:hypothetical protein